MKLTFTEPGCQSVPCDARRRHLTTKFLMRAGLFYVFFGLLSVQLLVAHSGKSQTLDSINVTVGLRNENLKKLFRIIQDQTGLMFAYQPEQIDDYQSVSLPRERRSVKATLDMALEGTRLRYRQVNNNVMIFTAEEEPSLREIEDALMTIMGGVHDDAGNPIPGVNVLVKGSTNGTTTDSEGKYSLVVLEEDAVLVFSFIGYITQEVAIENRTVIDVVLQEDIQSLEEVVVVGYGTQKKANLTGAVSSVDMEEVLGDRPVNSTAQALQGTLPGLEITSSSGRPGEPSSLNIRGINSIQGGQPLVLVDNVPMAIDNVNPRDIESVTILKDAAASSIYGGRAAYGVILITTKKGMKNQPIRFEYSNSFSLSQATDLPEKASTVEFLRAMRDFGTVQTWTGQYVDVWSELMTEYQNNPGAYPEGKTEVHGVVYHLAEADFFDTYLKNGYEQRHNLSFAGGSEKTSFRLSLGYADEDGIMITNKDSYSKYNVNAFLNTELTDKLEASANIFYTSDNRLTPSDYNQLFRYGVEYLDYTPTGFHDLGDGLQMPYYTPNNILKYEEPRKDFGDDIRLFGKLKYSPLKDLNIVGEYTFNKTNNNRRQYFSVNEYMNPMNIAVYTPNTFSSYLRSTAVIDVTALNLYASYEKHLNDHNFNFLVGANREHYNRENFAITGEDIISGDVPSISTATGTIAGSDSFGEYAILGYFGRINYNFRDKYLLEVNGRFDGSSRFPERDRYGFFPSFSAGWVVTEESFMEPVTNVVSDLKFRGSWGEIGNQDLGTDYYPFFSGMNPVYAGWIDPATNIRKITLSSPRLVSSSFTWETVRTLNLGTDLSLMRGRLNSTFDWFKRETLNMLAPGAELPSILGTEAPLQNVADLESRGWELTVSWKDRAKEFRYSFGVNLSDNRGFITKFDNPAGLISQYYVGQEIGEIWGFETQGFFTEDDFEPGTLSDNLTGGTLKDGIAAYQGYETKQNPGDIRYVDQNGDNVIDVGNNTLEDPGDRKVIGNSHRRYQFGVFGNAAFRNFDLSFFLQGVGKRDLWISNNLIWPYATQFSVVYKHNLDYWTPENTEGFYPRGYPDASGNTDNSRRVQTKYLSNGAYLRVKNVTLGYTVPQKLLEKIAIDQLRIFASGENLFTFDHLADGLSTELANVDRGASYPFFKKYSLGINVSF